MGERTYQRAMASVYLAPEDAAWIVTQTPREIVDTLRQADPDDLLELTLGNYSEWNGKSVFVRAGAITAIAPPKNQDEDD